MEAGNLNIGDGDDMRRNDEWLDLSHGTRLSGHEINWGGGYKRVIALNDALEVASVAGHLIKHSGKPGVSAGQGKWGTQHFNTEQTRKVREKRDGSNRFLRAVGKRSMLNGTSCQPMSRWQTASFPTCNIFHSIDMSNWGEGETGDLVEVLALGGKRIAWKYHRLHRDEAGVFATYDTVILKALRLVYLGFESICFSHLFVCASATESSKVCHRLLEKYV